MSHAPRMRGHALVIPAAILMALTGFEVSAMSAPNYRWEVKGRVHIWVSDYEEVGDNEYCGKTFEFTHTGNGQLPQSHWWYLKCGGEVRAEIHYTLNNFLRSATIDPGEVKLYEGTSGDTRDLDGGYPIRLTIPEGKPVTKVFEVHNAMEDEPEDAAKITITWHKIPVRVIGRPSG
ncbi:hypothetical protein ACIO7M_33445 [Streptomyces toxytricini]|uniref:Uncharacterized protein n=1 Tax=Streptomyces toxytricini TaxID=67369 RepID=A0ABW8ES55_STRT5